MKLSKDDISNNQEPDGDNPLKQHQLDIIRQLCESVFRGVSADEQMQQTLEAALELFDAKAASFQIYEAKSDALVFRKVANERDAPLIGRSISVQNGINGKVFRTGTAEVNRKVDDCPEWNSFVDRATGYDTQSMLTAPVKRPDGRPIGVVQVLNGESDFKKDDLKILEILCLYIGQAVENERLRQQSEARVTRLKQLRDFEAAIESSTDPEKTLENITEQLIKLLEVDAVRLWLYHSKSDSLQSIASRGLRSGATFLNSIPVGEGYVGRMASEALTSVSRENLTISLEDLTTETTELMTVGPLRAEGFVTYHAVPLFSGYEFTGVLDVYSRGRRSADEEWFQFFELLASLSASAITKANLLSSLQNTNLQLVTTFDDTLGGLASLLDLRAREPRGHVERVTQSMLRLARELGVPEESLLHMWRGAMLHDLGKIAVPDSILLKAGPLNEEEWLVMRNHPLHILELLWPIEYLRPALDIPCYHHERWDGSGYPHGLSGDQIPLGARIFAVIEAWDIMRCDRPFRAGWSEDKVRAYIAKQSGSAYDPRVVEAFQRLEL